MLQKLYPLENNVYTTINSWLTYLLSLCLCVTRSLLNIPKEERERETLLLRFSISAWIFQADWDGFRVQSDSFDI